MAPPSSRTTTRLQANSESGSPAGTPRLRTSRCAANVNSLTATGPASMSRHAGGVTIAGSYRLGKVDTNIKSYDRRDPFTAISTLIRLLTALPSRVLTSGGGGCLYKLLTFDEHKLCMHLCTIVEPFILSSASHCDEMGSPSENTHFLFKRRVLLIRQPTEILDRITSYIDNRDDLLSFGMTCKRLSEVVFPRHWEYRTIRAKVSMAGVWKHLIERTDLAANVRVVEVVDERSNGRVLVPRACRKSATSKGMKPEAVGLCGGVNADDVVSGPSTDDDLSSASGSEAGEVPVGGILKKVSIHKQQEKYFVAALEKMSGLLRLKWKANHTPISVLDSDSGSVWRILSEKCDGLEALDVVDNLTFSPAPVADEDEDSDLVTNQVPKSNKAVLLNLRSISMQSTQFSYGAPREPSMNRIITALHQCPNIENLEVTFRNSKTGTTPLPIANEFLVCGRWSNLRSLTLTNLACFAPFPASQISTPNSTLAIAIPINPLQGFLAAHPTLEVLKLVDIVPAAGFRRVRTPLAPNTLPRLRELHAGKDIVNMILRSDCDVPRPLEVIRGFKLVGVASSDANPVEKRPGSINVNSNVEFYNNLKKAGTSVRRIEIEGWSDLDDLKALAWCLPKLTWLDIGRRLKPTNGGLAPNPGVNAGSNSSSGGGSRGQAQAPVTKMVEWAEVLSNFEDLTTFHGVKFFYEISPNALPTIVPLHANDISTGHGPSRQFNYTNLNISKTDRSRIKKNDEIASVLAWKCPKLRRVDHWDGSGGSGGRVIVLCKDSNVGATGEGSLDKVRWEVRRVKS